jgi:hypothetical protein
MQNRARQVHEQKTRKQKKGRVEIRGEPSITFRKVVSYCGITRHVRLADVKESNNSVMCLPSQIFKSAASRQADTLLLNLMASSCARSSLMRVPAAGIKQPKFQ